MSYVAPYIDETGLHLPSYQDILADLIASAKEIFGNDIYLDNDSPDYQLLSIFALKQYDSMQTLAYCYNARSPGTAIGTSLDTIVKLNGIYRKSASHSTCQVILTGTAFTEINNGVATDVSGVKWHLPDTVIIGSAGTTVTTATCETTGPVNALAGDINKIETPTYGWISINNEVAAVLGEAQETDAELRIRQTQSVANPSQSLLSGIWGAIASLTDVTRCAVYENDTNLSAADGQGNNPYSLPPHSITAVVEGAEDNAIANIILNHKTPGCYTNGTVSVNITDVNDYVNTIRFSRPTYKKIYVKCVLVSYGGYTSSVLNTIKTTVYNYLSGASIGTDISISMLAGIIVNCNEDAKRPNFGISSLTIGTESGALTASDIVLDYNEVADPDLDNIEVTI